MLTVPFIIMSKCCNYFWKENSSSALICYTVDALLSSVSLKDTHSIFIANYRYTKIIWCFSESYESSLTQKIARKKLANPDLLNEHIITVTFEFSYTDLKYKSKLLVDTMKTIDGVIPKKKLVCHD